jgi:hypothetical protein
MSKKIKIKVTENLTRTILFAGVGIILVFIVLLLVTR